jgi:orotidine-5'-phosphate decarboxylase
MTNAKDKLIVALDVDNAERALQLFDTLRHTVGMFKIGMQLFTAAGPDVVRQIISRGGRVFLDLKYHDIPNTVALAGVEATRLGVSIFNVHASGGRDMLTRTAAAVAETAARENLARPQVIAVTLLTSVDEEALKQIGIEEAPPTIVPRLALLAEQTGLDGVVASAREIETIRQTVSTSGFLIVTPGMRGAGAASDDQRRTTGVADAIRSGADYIVVGRPVLAAPDPVAAAQQIVAEIATALPLTPTASDIAEQSHSQSVH